MKCELWYSVVVRDRKGKILSRERRRSRSFLKQWNQLVYLHLSMVASLTMTDIGGVSRAGTRSKYSFRMNAPIANINYGIVIGTDNTAVLISDYALGARIAEGVGAGQMNYQASSVATSVVAAPTCGWIASRAIVNNSGLTITVREAGIYGWLTEFSSWWVALVRDVLGTPQDVPDGGSMTINYTLRVSV
ncbi:hypothetical protein ES703_18966 [subsurface metagenome]